MIRFVLLALAVLVSCPESGFAEDYLVRIEKVGCVDRAAESKETALLTIDVIARPNAKFHTKAVIGKEAVVMAGKFRPSENGEFTIDIQFRHVIDTGEIIPTEDGRGRPRLNKTKLETTITITEGEPVTIAGIRTERKGPANSQTKSQERYDLVITKYDSSAD